MNKKTNEIIVMPYGEKINLARDFNTSKVTVISALYGRTNSKFAILLRKAALERGGAICIQRVKDKTQGSNLK